MSEFLNRRYVAGSSRNIKTVGSSGRKKLFLRISGCAAFIRVVSIAMALAWPVHADGGQRDKIDQAALHGLDDTNLVFKDKRVFLYGVRTNGPDTKMGKYGCAKVVSVTLRHAGIDLPILLGVSGIETELKDWKRIASRDSLLPGDVVIWVSRFKGNKDGTCTGSGTCHVGICSTKGYFHNNPLGYHPIFNGIGLKFGYIFKYGLRPPD
jgi:hypothetical protein